MSMLTAVHNDTKKSTLLPEQITEEWDPHLRMEWPSENLASQMFHAKTVKFIFPLDF